jgi:hypothetical protein
MYRRSGTDRTLILSCFAPYLKGESARQGIDLLLDSVPCCERCDALEAIDEFVPILRDLEGPTGLREVERAIRDCTRWFP